MNRESPIQVVVEPVFLEDQSLPLENHYVWALQVWIENQGAENVQLLSRLWRMTDRNGITQEVNGQGVVGEKPWIAPGAMFHYTSGTSLTAPSGLMEGTYHMCTQEGKKFDVTIPAFSLDSPHETASVH